MGRGESSAEKGRAERRRTERDKKPERAPKTSNSPKLIKIRPWKRENAKFGVLFVTCAPRRIWWMLELVARSRTRGGHGLGEFAGMRDVARYEWWRQLAVMHALVREDATCRVRIG
ncbi:hypothetical protein Scep_019091 [Stephania cephalantha]|uniref:Uncharacterized protein n=1 Tax=Stephania cephalantha TaxID=152367 RepID=A0AAP0IAJ9_9MAGN